MTIVGTHYGHSDTNPRLTRDEWKREERERWDRDAANAMERRARLNTPWPEKGKADGK